MKCPVGPNFMQYLHRDIRGMGADDIAVVWNGEIERFQVLQVEHDPNDLMDGEGYMRRRGRLIFTVQEKDGGYRPLDRRTLDMIARSIELGRAIWDVPEHKRLEKLEAYEKGIYEKKREKAREQLAEQIKDYKKTMTRKIFT